MRTALPYGSWPSPITPQLMVDGAAALTELWATDDTVWWSELRPAESGRIQIVVAVGDEPPRDVLPDGFSARTRVHEYGGGAWWVDGAVVYFANWDDQRLYRIVPGGEPTAITPEPPTPHAWRYADGRPVPGTGFFVAVRESHTGEGEALNELVALRADGSGEAVVLASGRDFVAAPRPSPDGSQLAWITWDHPNMPWDDTELWAGTLRADGDTVRLVDAARLAGEGDESLMEPRWSPDGVLHVISDRTGWWNVYRVAAGELVARASVDEEIGGPAALGDQQRRLRNDGLTPTVSMAAEVGGPAWVFGRSSYAFDDGGALYQTWSEGGRARLGRVEPGSDHLDTWAFDDAKLREVHVAGGAVVAIAEPVDREPEVVRIDLDSGEPVRRVLRPGRDLRLALETISVAQKIEFPSAGGRTAHGYYYPPKSAEYEGPEGELPPLLVMSHGGPTSAARSSFNLGIQYWTSRGFAVVDVDYGGSTGYGREYRRLLNGTWGIVDVEDCCAAAAHLASHGLADPDRLAIRGGSAGGFTTLAALAGTDTFRAGANHFGVSDMGALAAETHKFESRYLDNLVGPWPEASDIYRERSPINNVDGFDCPLITFQGLEDEIVLPNQSERIVEALDAKGIPHAYLAFEGEQHGFRKAETIMAVLDAELSFYGQVFGFEPDGIEEPVTLAHADKL